MDLISRQAAIDALCSECQGRCIPCENYPCSEVEAINALPSAHTEIEERKEESAQNVPKEDLISRKAAIDAINKALDRETLLNSFVRKVAVDALKTMPSAQPDWNEMIVMCDCCGHAIHVKRIDVERQEE